MSESKDIHIIETTAIRLDGVESDNDFELVSSGIWLRDGSILLHIYRPYGTHGQLMVEQGVVHDVDRIVNKRLFLDGSQLLDPNCPCCTALYEDMVEKANK
jgi:hypothetical protein